VSLAQWGAPPRAGGGESPHKSSTYINSL